MRYYQFSLFVKIMDKSVDADVQVHDARLITFIAQVQIFVRNFALLVLFGGYIAVTFVRHKGRSIPVNLFIKQFKRDDLNKNGGCKINACTEPFLCI